MWRKILRWLNPHACRRVAGDLKVCSASLYFVPRAVHEPIFRLPYRAVRSLERYASTAPTPEAEPVCISSPSADCPRLYCCSRTAEELSSFSHTV